MKIILLGYGKMGQTIEKLAEEAGEEIVLTVDEGNRADISAKDLRGADVAIEFSRPEAAVANVQLALEAGVPIVVGTTGWLAELPAIAAQVAEREGALFWASNFSIGVNIFFAAARRAAELAGKYGGYAAAVTETHHVQKLDAPSGTGITLAETVAEVMPDYDSWKLAAVDSPVAQTHIAPASAPDTTKKPLPISAVRKAGVHGTHLLTLEGASDTLRLEHTAHDRMGFAGGALTAARWLIGKQGVFTMADMLKL